MPRTPNKVKLPWGPFEVDADMANRHFLVVGASGSGKTVTINRLLRAVVGEITRGNSDWRLVIYDGKTEVLSALKAFGLPGKRLRLLHPFDSRGYAWDLAQDISGPEEIQEFANLLFPPQESMQPFFQDSVTDLLQGVLHSYRNRWPAAMNRRWELRDVCLGLSNINWLRRILLWDEEVNTTRVMLYFADRRLANNICATIRTRIAPYEIIAAHWHRMTKANRSLSLESWVRSSEVLVLGHSHRSTAALRAINRLLFHRLSQLLLDLPSGTQQRSWVFLDELSKAGRLDGLDLLLTKGRSKGVCVVMGFQDIAGLQNPAVYGEEMTEEMTSQVANKAFLRLQGSRTSKWAEEAIGMQQVAAAVHMRGANGDSMSESFEYEPRVRDCELLSIPTLGKNGIGGVYTEANAREPQRWVLPWSEVRKLPATDPDVDYIGSDKADGYLEPWSAAELKALGLEE